MKAGLKVKYSQLKKPINNLTMKKEITYSEAIEELEKIVSIIENEAVNIDELSAKVKRAAELINVCKDKLHNTEEEVNRILKDING